MSHLFPSERGMEQAMTLIISLAIWLQGCIKGESVECVFSVPRELQDESKIMCVCVSYTGFVLMAAELSQDVLSMGGAHADLRETRQPLRCHVELGTHLRGETHCCVVSAHVT